MKNLAILILLSISTKVYNQPLPQNVRMDTVSCSLAAELKSHYLYKNNEAIGYVYPENCNYGNEEDVNKNPHYVVEFFPTYQKDTFATVNEALTWLINSINAYYKPVVIYNWKNLNSQNPKLSLDYPENWIFRVENYPIFKSKTTGNNKLVLLMAVRGGNSEIGQIIRTPNTGKLTTVQVMEMTAQINRAINFNTNPTVDQLIDGKIFKTMSHEFMQFMQQSHYWYADENEIIYITYGLLKDDRVRFPEVLKQIVQNIKW